jgi:hypothetical protein
MEWWRSAAGSYNYIVAGLGPSAETDHRVRPVPAGKRIDEVPLAAISETEAEYR